MADDTEPQPAGFGLPAVFANRFNVRIDGDMSRVVFGDALIGKHANHHTHLIMRTSDLEALGTLVAELIAKRKTPGG